MNSDRWTIRLVKQCDLSQSYDFYHLPWSFPKTNNSVHRWLMWNQKHNKFRQYLWLPQDRYYMFVAFGLRHLEDLGLNAVVYRMWKHYFQHLPLNATENTFRQGFVFSHKLMPIKSINIRCVWCSLTQLKQCFCASFYFPIPRVFAVQITVLFFLWQIHICFGERQAHLRY